MLSADDRQILAKFGALDLQNKKRAMDEINRLISLERPKDHQGKLQVAPLAQE